MLGYHLLSTRPSTASVFDPNPNPTPLSVRRPSWPQFDHYESADMLAASCELDVIAL